MSQHFQNLEQNVANHTQELMNFCMQFKDHMTSIALDQDKSIDATVNHVSKELLQQEVTISNELTESTNKTVIN